MYLHLGGGVMVAKKSIVGVFDLDNTSQSHITRAYLAKAEKKGEIINAAEDIPKSFVVCRDGEGMRIYLSQMAVQTLLKRANENSVY
ncbi:MAG: DUF370 domain-containing protein [Oscillospiraceae bacterium]|nr:DUF370 domain-containing protein [Oscillospiraceae bacterium]